MFKLNITVVLLICIIILLIIADSVIIITGLKYKTENDLKNQQVINLIADVVDNNNGKANFYVEFYINKGSSKSYYEIIFLSDQFKHSKLNKIINSRYKIYPKRIK